MAQSIRIEGLQKTLARFDIKKFESKVQVAFDNFGKNIERDAKQNISNNKTTDQGLLARSVFWDTTKLGVIVGDSAKYASYIEFGTRKYAASYIASLPTDWKAVAEKSKGNASPGTFDEFVQNIFAWVERKGIGAIRTKSGNKSTSKASLESMQQAAYWIAINILQNGIPAQPYLYPAVNKNIPILIKELQNLTFDQTGFSKVTIQRRTF